MILCMSLQTINKDYYYYYFAAARSVLQEISTNSSQVKHLGEGQQSTEKQTKQV